MPGGEGHEPREKGRVRTRDDRLRILSVRAGRIVTTTDGRLWLVTRGVGSWQVSELLDVTAHGTPVWDPVEGERYPFRYLPDAYHAIGDLLEAERSEEP